jgi:CubicO group peptidase (beta-lactamase class C family)
MSPVIETATPPLPVTRPELVGMSPARLARIRPAMEREMAAGRLPGCVVAIARDGKLVHLEAIGWGDPESRAPMQVDAIFSIASMTKPVTGVVALSLIEEGRLLVTDPVGAWLPPLMQMQVAKTTPAMLSGKGSIETEAARRPMTVQDAMRHTTGLVYGGRDGTAVHAIAPPGSFWVAENMDTEGFAQTLSGLPLRHHPGTVWEYGLSTDVLGGVAERAGGASLGALMRELPAEKLARFARPFAKDPITGAAQSVEAPMRAPKMETGGAGLVSTASDYLRFAEMLRAGGTLNGVRVLAPQTVAWMASDHLQGIENRVAGMDPALEGYGFGLTVAVRLARGGSGMMGAPGAFGWSGVWGTYFWADPVERLSVVFMAHAPGELRQRYRRLINMLTYQAIEA